MRRQTTNVTLSCIERNNLKRKCVFYNTLRYTKQCMKGCACVAFKIPKNTVSHNLFLYVHVCVCEEILSRFIFTDLVLIRCRFSRHTHTRFVQEGNIYLCLSHLRVNLTRASSFPRILNVF